MQKYIVFFLCLTALSVETKAASVRVCEADGNTPFDYRDIMVGTKLTFIVSSDSNGYLACDLAILYDDRNRGILAARDCNGIEGACSVLPAAGEGASVVDWEEPDIAGFSMYTSHNAVPGDLFIIDYQAIDIGDCNVSYYEQFEFDHDIPLTHVRTRDFDASTKVDFADYTIFASNWLQTGCGEPNWCFGTDLDTDGTVDCNDLMLLTDYWLEETE